MGLILEHVDEPAQIVGDFTKFLAAGGNTFLAMQNVEVLSWHLGRLAGTLADMKALSDSNRTRGHKRYTQSIR